MVAKRVYGAQGYFSVLKLFNHNNLQSIEMPCGAKIIGTTMLYYLIIFCFYHHVLEQQNCFSFLQVSCKKIDGGEKKEIQVLFLRIFKNEQKPRENRNI